MRANIIFVSLLKPALTAGLTLVTNQSTHVPVVLGLTGTGAIHIDWGDGTNANGTLGTYQTFTKASYSGSGPYTITVSGVGLTSISKIVADNINATSIIISALHNITDFSAINNMLVTLDISSIGPLANIVISGNNNLTDLYLSHNNISSLEFLSSLPNLKNMYIAYNSLLTTVDVNSYGGNGNSSFFTSRLPAIETVDISHTVTFSDTDPSGTAGRTFIIDSNTLKTIKANDCNFNYMYTDYYQTLGNLTELDFRNNNLYNADIGGGGIIMPLQNVYLSGNTDLGDINIFTTDVLNILDINTSLPLLTYFNLSGSMNQSIFNSVFGLTTTGTDCQLTMTGTSGITRGSITIPYSYDVFKYITLENYPNINLQTLSSKSILTDLSLTNMGSTSLTVTSCANLSNFAVHNCTSITNLDLSAKGGSGNLSIQNCTALTTVALYSTMYNIEIQDCHNITSLTGGTNIHDLNFTSSTISDSTLNLSTRSISGQLGFWIVDGINTITLNNKAVTSFTAAYSSSVTTISLTNLVNLSQIAIISNSSLTSLTLSGSSPLLNSIQIDGCTSIPANMMTTIVQNIANNATSNNISNGYLDIAGTPYTFTAIQTYLATLNAKGWTIYR